MIPDAFCQKIPKRPDRRLDTQTELSSSYSILGGGLPFTHPYQFYITFVSKTHFFAHILHFTLTNHSKLIYNPNDRLFFSFTNFFTHTKFFHEGSLRSEFQNFDTLTWKFGPENFFIPQISNVSSSHLQLIFEGLMSWEWVYKLIVSWKFFTKEVLGQGIKISKLWPGSLAQKIFIRKNVG